MKKLLLLIFLIPAICSAQSVGALKTQEIYSPTGKVSIYGQVQLRNNADKVCWRNAASTADICIYLDSSDTLEVVPSTGVFTNTQQNDQATFLLNGLEPGSEYTTEQGSQHATESLVGGIAVPSSATVWGGTAVAGYATDRSTTTNAVGGYFQARCLVSNANCWGSNPLVADVAGMTGHSLIGSEIDMDLNGAPNRQVGLQVTGLIKAGATQGATSEAIQVTGQAGLWRNGFVVGDQSVTSDAIQTGAPCVADSKTNCYGNAWKIYSNIWKGTSAVRSYWYLKPNGTTSGVPTSEELDIVHNGAGVTSNNTAILPNVSGYITVKGGGGTSSISAGEIQLNGSGTARHTFRISYTSQPMCTANDENAPNAVQVSLTGTGPWTALTLTGTANDFVMWMCIPAGN